MTAIGIVVRDGAPTCIGSDSAVVTGPSVGTAVKIIIDGPWAFAVGGAQEPREWLVHDRPPQDDGEDPRAYVSRIAALMRDWIKAACSGSDARLSAVVYACPSGAWVCDTSCGVPMPVTDGCTGLGDPTAVSAAFRACRPFQPSDGMALHAAIDACCVECFGVGGPVRVYQLHEGRWVGMPW